ncbi:MAG: hypothetical protein P0Y66_04025 [Candidatus Kaistia colombiensis]|nr:MAG: hypothetical protein P0Y66_04025 [Kaistia sp.]
MAGTRPSAPAGDHRLDVEAEAPAVPGAMPDIIIARTNSPGERDRLVFLGGTRYQDECNSLPPWPAGSVAMSAAQASTSS